MGSRRAPEMAAGATMHFLFNLLRQASPMLLALPCVAVLSEEERAIVIGDFQRARQHLLLVFALKFSHWRQLPWVIMGAAHPDLATARSCARRALSLYATAAAAVQARPVVRM